MEEVKTQPSEAILFLFLILSTFWILVFVVIYLSLVKGVKFLINRVKRLRDGKANW